MKKLLSLLTAGMLLLSMTTSVFAAEAETKPVSTAGKTVKVQEKLTERKAQREEKKEEIAAFKAALQAKKEITKAAAEENKTLRQANHTLKEQLAQIIADKKTNDVALDETVKTQLAAKREQVKAIKEELKATKGSIKALFEANKEAFKNLDYTALDTVFAEIATIQSQRKVKLTEIGSILGEMVALVQ